MFAEQRGMSTNEFIAEMNNVRPVWAGRLHAETLILASRMILSSLPPFVVGQQRK